MQLTDTQHRILVALSRPARAGNGFAPPATNQEIAGEVFLSVDAVKAHLRTLYRKFGIEDLPQNQKRARLVELVVEGGILDRAPVSGEGGGEEPAAPPARPALGHPAPGRDRNRALRLGLALAGLVVIVALAVLVATGSLSSDDSGETTGVVAYRSEVRGYCRLGLGTGEGEAGTTARLRARSYLGVIETVRGRVESLAPPAESDQALQRFRAGLTAAANFTSVVAEKPPADGSPKQANVVAQLTFAAGQVQAGALGYGLGPACVAIGEVISRSASNAAGAP